MAGDGRAGVEANHLTEAIQLYLAGAALRCLGQHTVDETALKDGVLVQCNMKHRKAAIPGGLFRALALLRRKSGNSSARPTQRFRYHGVRLSPTKGGWAKRMGGC